MILLPAFLQKPDPSVYLGHNYVVLDFEIDVQDGAYGHAAHKGNSLLLACWRTGKDHPFSIENIWGCDEWTEADWGSEYEQAMLISAIEAADFIVAHNAKYELGWLKRCGLDLRKILVFDTKLGEYVLMGNLAAGDEFNAPRSISLDACCIRRGWKQKDPVVDIMMGHGINPASMPRPWLEGRCRQDVESTERLFLDQRAKLAATNRLPVLYTRCLLTPVLAEMEFEGMALDPERVEQAYTETLAEFKTLQGEMDAMTGGINWRSSKQAGEFIYDKLQFEELRKPGGEPRRTPEGKRLTDQKTLDALQARTPEQKAFVALRKKLGKVSAALTKNLEFFRGVCVERNSVFLAEFQQTNTATHRLSSTGVPITFELFKDEKGKPQTKSVQFQNLPRRFKRLFKAKREGYLMAEPDGAQLEFRIAGQLSGDKQILADIADPDFDAHITSGAAMEQRDYAEMLAAYRAGDKKTTEQRQQAKSETFKPLYGGSKGTKKQERWYEQFKARYKDLAKTQAGWVSDVVKDKMLVTEWGMRYYWPHARISSSGYVNVTAAVYNYPVQAFATAEVIPVAIVYLWHLIEEAGISDRVFFVNTVHDSLAAEVHPEVVAKFRELVTQAFTYCVFEYVRTVYKMEFRVPLGAGFKIGSHLGEGEEEKIDVWPDGREQRKAA